MINNTARGSAHRGITRYRRAAMRISPAEVFMNTAVLSTRLRISPHDMKILRGGAYCSPATRNFRAAFRAEGLLQSLYTEGVNYVGARLRISG